MLLSILNNSLTSLFRVLAPPASSMGKQLFLHWSQNERRVPCMIHSVRKACIQCRHYAATSNKQISKPPAKAGGLSGRYAEALFSAAVKMDALKKVEEDFQKLQSVLEKDPRLRELFLKPSTSKIIKTDDMKAILSRLSLCPTTNNFMMTLTENSRLYLLESIIQTFLYLMSIQRGELVCQVITAEPLQEDLKKKLIDNVRIAYKDRRTVTLVNIVDPSIVGGMILKIDDYQIDQSIATRMRQLTKLLSAP